MTIGEISVQTGLPESTLRYYESKKLIKVSRDSGGRRDYAQSDIEWVKFIQRLKKNRYAFEGYPALCRPALCR